MFVFCYHHGSILLPSQVPEPKPNAKAEPKAPEPEPVWSSADESPFFGRRYLRLKREHVVLKRVIWKLKKLGKPTILWGDIAGIEWG